MKRTRRNFFYLASGSIGATLLAPILTKNPGYRRFTRRSRALGSAVTLIVWHNDQAVAEKALAAAFEEIDRVEDIMSLYRPDSALCRLNSVGALQSPHPDLARVMAFSQQLAYLSNGAFDITVQPIWKARQENRNPRSALGSVDWRHLHVSAEQIRFAQVGMSATLNGVAQGFAADRVAATLQRHGIHRALIDTGEVSALGRREEEKPWQVGVQHPRQPEDFLCLTGLTDRCLATSGDYSTVFSEDFSDHHLIDPRTGLSPPELSSVSVAASTAMEADALSTAAFVLGLERGMALIEKTPGADALMVRKSDGRTYVSNGFPVANIS